MKAINAVINAGDIFKGDVSGHIVEIIRIHTGDNNVKVAEYKDISTGKIHMLPVNTMKYLLMTKQN